MSALVTTRRPGRYPRDADDCAVDFVEAAVILQKHSVPTEWGMPIEARGWFNSAGRLLLLNAGFSNGRTAHLRLFATTWCLTFGYDASLLQNAILEEA